MLLSLNIAQLILYIGGLSLIGQALLFVLSGQKRDTNLFYQLFQILNKPWTAMARFISPKQIADHQIPFVAFCILAILYIVVTLAKIEHCVSIGIELCQ
ncbi:MAG: hypothetical protein ACOYKP_09185 [Polynucleobacter sp.]